MRGKEEKMQHDREMRMQGPLTHMADQTHWNLERQYKLGHTLYMG